MATLAEKQAKLNETVEGLGTAKFGLVDATVPVAAVIADGGSKFVLMDTRSEEEMAVGMIPGAITRAAFEAEPDKFKDREVVAYCTVGYISGACAFELRKKGHSNVKNMGDGALLGYTLAKTAAGVDKPLVKPADGSATNEVHTFMDGMYALIYGCGVASVCERERVCAFVSALRIHQCIADNLIARSTGEHACIHARVRFAVCVYMHVCMHACIHTYIIHTHIRIPHVCTCMHAYSPSTLGGRWHGGQVLC